MATSAKKAARDECLDDPCRRAQCGPPMEEGSVDLFYSRDLAATTGDERAFPPISEGENLGGFQVIRLLGAGERSKVFLAKNMFTSEEVALKVIRVPGEDEAERLTRQIMNEFSLRRRLTDMRHIIQAQDPRLCEYGTASLVLQPMEYVPGGSLRSWLEKNPDLEERRPEALRLFIGACHGIAAAHAAGIDHLDIKPENILLIDGVAKISDFGIGRHRRPGITSRQDLRQGVGTPRYMAPEQFVAAREDRIGERSDIYALGATLYEIVDGSPPFDGTPEELMTKHQSMAPPPLKGVGAGYWPIVERCLKKDPEDRYADVETLIRDLERVSRGAPLSVDVACPRCGHLNGNDRKRYCEKCGESLSGAFRPCPRCPEEVRKDVDTCDNCGYDVGAHYLFQERWAAIQNVKNRNPLEALRLLGVAIREGARDKEREAQELVRSLRGRLQTVAGLITEAQTAFGEKNYTRSLELWNAVTGHFPGHQEALGAIERIRSILAEYMALREKARAALSQARFEEGITLLGRCSEMVPDQEGDPEMLQDARRWPEEFRTALGNGHWAYERKALGAARTAVEEALKRAPQSPDALSLKGRIEDGLQQAEHLLDETRQHAERADFDRAGSCLEAAGALRSDEPRIEETRGKLKETRQTYRNLFGDVQDAMVGKQLLHAHRQIRSALRLCPQSPEAKALAHAIVKNQESARDCLRRALRHKDSAEFGEAGKILVEAEEIWRDLEELVEAKTAQPAVEKGYIATMASAQENLRRKRFAEARNLCAEALSLCPSSVESESLLARIEENERDYQERRERRRRRLAKAAKWLGLGARVSGRWVGFVAFHLFKLAWSVTLFLARHLLLLAFRLLKGSLCFAYRTPGRFKR